MKLKMVGTVTMYQSCTMRAQQSVQFQFWLKTLKLEIIMLLYVRAPNEGNFQLVTDEGCLLSTTHTKVGGYLYTFET